jgi:hypothetical protein
VNGKCLNNLEVGCRVWSAWGLHEHGHDKVSVPKNTGGTVIQKWNEFSTMDNPLYRVKWDTGQQSVHYYNTLYCIGRSQTEAAFTQSILAEASSVKITRGPMGGIRRFTIFLKNGDWIEGMVQLQPQLEAAKVPIELEQLERKKRIRV